MLNNISDAGKTQTQIYGVWNINKSCACPFVPFRLRFLGFASSRDENCFIVFFPSVPYPFALLTYSNAVALVHLLFNENTNTYRKINKKR